MDLNMSIKWDAPSMYDFGREEDMFFVREYCDNCVNYGDENYCERCFNDGIHFEELEEL